ncbi:hypothetical protein Rumeso_04455 [Rubellimicrobium mesophilum DSM 19309]|uniref:Uncharacterized protein n=1 Tax=Rubellimicrobium mesophilum DSM 19309 TaxID=442562 RepID=A0A017HI15_9RHOB|nr:hypothetical protein Rumeso_04455 [Rubellimicrobium mesophilum DSM 19309]
MLIRVAVKCHIESGPLFLAFRASPHRPLPLRGQNEARTGKFRPCPCKN